MIDVGRSDDGDPRSHVRDTNHGERFRTASLWRRWRRPHRRGSAACAVPAATADLAAVAAELRIAARAGCDPAPLDPSLPGDQLTLLSYIWPDELHRIERMRAALSVAARDPVPVVAPRGSEWLPDALAAAHDGELVVIWHSVMRQYVQPEEWAAIEGALDGLPIRWDTYSAAA